MNLLSRFTLLILMISMGSVVRLAAQTLPTTPEYPRYFVGASCILGNYEATYPRIRSYDEGVFSPCLTLGYQLVPRAAVQLSLERSSDQLSIDSFLPLPNGQSTRFQHYQENHQHFAIPLVLRLTGTRQLNHRLQFDALAGFTIIHSSFSRVFEGFNEQQQSISYSELAERTTNLALSIGGGIRYRFGRHLEAVADANLNRTISSASTSGFVNVYTTGLRYRFGYR